MSHTTDTPRIGFAGVGLMGQGMAKNILEAGFPLTVIAHRKREPVEDLKTRGAKEASDTADLCEASDILVLCLPGSPQVEDFVATFLAGDCEGKTIVDCSTSNPVSTRALAERCREKGATLIDAPLSRTPKEAWEGTLDVMVGASEADFQRLKPLLDVVGGKVVRVGEVGAGHTMKLLNNFLSLGYASIYAEAFAIGAKNGLDPATIDGVISGGRMDCPFWQTFKLFAVNGDREAHKFALSNAHKDMRYVVSMATESGVATRMAGPIKDGLATAEAIGRGGDYLPFLTEIVAELNGVKPLKTTTG